MPLKNLKIECYKKNFNVEWNEKKKLMKLNKLNNVF